MDITEYGEFNESGYATNCHFYKVTRRSTTCAALRDFYNADSDDKKCDKCPFFKTDEEFEKGYKHRRTITDQCGVMVENGVRTIIGLDI